LSRDNFYQLAVQFAAVNAIHPLAKGTRISMARGPNSFGLGRGSGLLVSAVHLVSSFPWNIVIIAYGWKKVNRKIITNLLNPRAG
jgi:hypothetical protein